MKLALLVIMPCTISVNRTANDYDYVKALKSKKNKQEISEAKIYENTSTVSSTESKENNPELQENPAYCNIADHEYSNVVRQ